MRVNVVKDRTDRDWVVSIEGQDRNYWAGTWGEAMSMAHCLAATDHLPRSEHRSQECPAYHEDECPGCGRTDGATNGASACATCGAPL